MKRVLKNKAERKEWIKKYHNWEVISEIPELKLKFFKYEFDNGDKFIVIEYFYPGNEYCAACYKNKYGLITTEKSNYTGGYGQFYVDAFDPAGCSKGNLIDYLTKVRPEVECYE